VIRSTDRRKFASFDSEVLHRHQPRDERNRTHLVTSGALTLFESQRTHVLPGETHCHHQ